MTLEEYAKNYPNENVWRNRANVIQQGMLQFDETADCLAGPFEGGFAYFRVEDHRNNPFLKSEDEVFREFQFSHHRFPYGRYGSPAENDKHLQTRLLALTAREQKAYHRALDGWILSCPTTEKPFTLFIGGNDDSSYSKFFATLEEAIAELNLLESMQPCNFKECVGENNFVFTN